MKPTTARLLLLAALLVSFCLPLSAHVPVSEKPHLGFEARETPSHQGFALANSLNAPGLAESLCEHRVRSRCSAKERDEESGLDYFGARYYASSLGRFTGPDEPLVDQLESEPQSWNLYGYVRNNPLRFFDPTGRVCKQLPDGNFEGDCSSPGDEKVTQGDKAQQETVTAFSPPSPLLLAVAQGTQRAKPVVEAAAVGTAVVVGGGTVAMAAGASGLTTIGTAGAPLVPLVPRLQTTLQQGFRVVGQGLTRIRAITNGRLKGFNRGNTELQGGDQAARSVFQRISGRLPIGDFDRAISGGREVVYRSAQRAGSGQPKIEIVDTAQRFLEKITFK